MQQIGDKKLMVTNSGEVFSKNGAVAGYEIGQQENVIGRDSNST